MPTCRRCQELKADSEFYESHPRNCKRCVYIRKMELIHESLSAEQKPSIIRRHPIPCREDITIMEAKAIGFAEQNRYRVGKNPYVSQLLSITEDYLASMWQRT